MELGVHPINLRILVKMTDAFVQDLVRDTTHYEDLFTALRDKLSTQHVRQANVNILILNAPCNGFGDLVFAWKLAKLLRYMYPHSSVKIATTQPQKLITLGEVKENLFRLATKPTAHQQHFTQCRSYRLLHVYHLEGSEEVDTSGFDLFFDAPITTDSEPNLPAVRKMVPTATPFNTFTFSEYNDTLKKDFDFHTGVGQGRVGLLLLPPSMFQAATRAEVAAVISKGGKYRYPYALMYINMEYAESSWKQCAFDFLRMVAQKYGVKQGERRFQVVMPPAMVKKAALTSARVLKKLFGDAFDRVVVVQKDQADVVVTLHGQEQDDNSTRSRTVFLRADVMPVPNKLMTGLMRDSVKDILITGDQSLTDVLNCCPEKNVFYQVMSWKRNLAEQLARLMPNPYLKHAKSSCGSVGAIKYTSNYARFIHDQSFLHLASDKLDRIVAQAEAAKRSASIRMYMDAVTHSRSVAGVLKLLELGARHANADSRRAPRARRYG